MSRARNLSAIFVIFLFLYFPVQAFTQCSSPPTDMTNWWDGDNNALDIVGPHDGTLIGDTVYADGIIGKAFSFDGVGDYVALPVSSDWDFGTGSFTINAWFKTSMSGSYGNIIRYHSGGGASGLWGLRMNQSNRVEFLIANDSGSMSLAATTTNYNDDNWHFVTVVRDGGFLRIYIDGAVAAPEVSDGNKNVVAPGVYPTIGGGGFFNSEYFDGLIDDVQIFDRGLSLAEHQAIYCTAGDTTPDTFAFTDKTGVALSSVTTSDNITVSDINLPTPISISSCTGSSCEYSLNSGTFSGTAGTVVNGDTVQVRQTSSSSAATVTNLVLDIGGVTDTFSITTCTTITYYRDADNDTYGNLSDSVVACSLPAGYVTNNGDCDDTRFDVKPGALEKCDGLDNNCDSSIDDNLTAPNNSLQNGVCNGSKQTCDGGNGWIDDYTGIATYEAVSETTCDSFDNDCDGNVDETLTTTYYQDSDNDTYGDATVSQDVCSQPIGYVLDSTDCDDTNKGINIDIIEICDSIDNNCDSQIDENKVCIDGFWLLILPSILNSADSTQ